MGRIAAIINFKRSIKLESARIERMLHANSQHHQMFTRTHALLVSETGQIDASKCQTLVKVYHGVEYILVFDGELYNKKELQRLLIQAGYYFEGDSDTEILLFAYKEWGEACLSRFNGVFAFVLTFEDHIFAGRDQMGVRPLYYVLKADGEWLFASAIQSFLREGSIRPILTKEKFMKMIALGPSLLPQETIYKNIKALPPGHYLTIHLGRFQLVQYYQLAAKPHVDDFMATKQHVHDLVANAVLRQCNYGGTIGSMLSGGLDSSIVTMIASRVVKDLPTFSLDYEENHESFQSTSYQASEDEPLIKEMVAACDSMHSVHVIPQAILVQYLGHAMRSRDMPGMADIDSSLLWFCQQMKGSIEVALTGECADEVFGGYPWFYRADLVSIDTFPWLRSLPQKIYLLNDKWKKLDFYGVRKEAYEQALSKVTYLDQDDEADKIARKMTYLSMDYFMQTLLSRFDTMAWSAGLQGRVPFADVELVNYVYNIPWEYKFYQQQEKGILREAFANELPALITAHRKKPFPKTNHPIYTEMVIAALNDALQSDSVLKYLFDETTLQELIHSKGSSFDQPWFGQLMKGPQLLGYLYQIHVWLESYQVQIEF